MPTRKKRGPTPRRAREEPRRRGVSAFQLVFFPLAALTIAVGVFFVVTRDNAPPARSLLDVVAGSDPGPVHVHGLGVDPASGTLFVATHTGLYRVAPGETKARLVGESRQDTMGFTVAGPGYFLGSGHPDHEQAREEGLPPLLGLIESRNEGRTWTPVSLTGEADFHVLRFAGERVYGYDASNDRLLVSADAGRTWQERSRPAPLLDLAVDPRDAEHVVATTVAGPYVSTDGGRSWDGAPGPNGLLGWTDGRLYVAAGSGRVSWWGGRRRGWTAAGDVGGEPAALLAVSARELYVALHDGTIKRSGDGGRTWAVRSTP